MLCYVTIVLPPSSQHSPFNPLLAKGPSDLWPNAEAYLAQIEADLAVTHPDVARALTRLWRFVEEEEAMAREISFVQQVIELDGKRLLADVARIDMALMYFRLPNGEMGWVVRTSNQWQFERIERPEVRQTITSIFNDLENNKLLGAKRLLISTDLPRALNRDLQ